MTLTNRIRTVTGGVPPGVDHVLEPVVGERAEVGQRGGVDVLEVVEQVPRPATHRATCSASWPYPVSEGSRGRANRSAQPPSSHR